MSETAAAPDHGAVLLDLYDQAVVDVYRYLHYRCRNAALSEELTAETFMAAVESIRRDAVQSVTTAWLMGIARHKLVDHWRRSEREQRNLHAVDEPAPADDPWDAELDGFAARDVLERMATQQRAALTLRYVDDLPVNEVAAVLGRSVHATESLLVRARRTFRDIYEQGGPS